MKIKSYSILYFTFLLFICKPAYSLSNPPKNGLWTIYNTKNSNKPTFNAAPILTATGNSVYCPLTNANIVSTVSITDSDDTSTEAIYIQISSGYIAGQDLLNLNNTALHPTITSTWNPAEGKLTLKSSNPIPGTLVSYSDFENAIKDVQFSNSSTNPSGNRNFSISLVQANYLPRNGHYYFYIPSLGITWTAAKTAAENQFFYGLKGYLATLTAADESQLAGTQAPGAGWIGGTDSETEGIWKWATGPEAGTVFWNGLANGSAPNFALWNTGEPNQFGDEDYAHITAPGIGIPGSWNDLSNTGDTSGNYQPKGYIVEYGGMPGDPILNLSASTSLTISSISSTTPASLCDPGIVTLQATSTSGSVNWYESATGGTVLFTGNTYVTPFLSTSKTYYAVANNCLSARTPIIATINTTPTITSTNNPATRCGAGTVTLQANSSNGIINWYTDATGATIIATGTSLTLPNVTTNTTYYVQAINNGCTNGIRVPVSIIINPFPIVNDENIIFCQSSSVVLDAGVSGMLYNWSTGQTSQTIIVSAPGIYTVDVTSPENCTSSKKITVTENLIPEIKTILVNETSVSIELVNSSTNFEYSIDGVNFQSSNLFINVPAGKQTAYVRDTSLCSIDQGEFIVVSPPLFFTPNKDNYHDTWEIGLINYPDAEVTIFDRYGKFIIKLNYNNTSWDGTLNNELLPASDYWYVLKLDKTAPEKRGHFSLKR